MIVLTAKYFVKTGKGDEVDAALRRMAPLVEATEPGCEIIEGTIVPLLDKRERELYQSVIR